MQSRARCLDLLDANNRGWRVCVQQKWRGAGGGVVMILLLLLQSLSLSTAPLWYTASVRARKTGKRLSWRLLKGRCNSCNRLHPRPFHARKRGSASLRRPQPDLACRLCGPRYAILTSSASPQSPINPGLTTAVPRLIILPARLVRSIIACAVLVTPQLPSNLVRLPLPPADMLDSRERLAIIIIVIHQSTTTHPLELLTASR